MARFASSALFQLKGGQCSCASVWRYGRGAPSISSGGSGMSDSASCTAVWSQVCRGLPTLFVRVAARSFPLGRMTAALGRLFSGARSRWPSSFTLLCL